MNTNKAYNYYNNYNYEYENNYHIDETKPVRKKNKKKEQIIERNRKKARRITPKVVMKIMLILSMGVFSCSFYLTLKDTNQIYRTKVTGLQAQYDELKRTNDDFEDSLVSAIDLDKIKKQASKLGLKEVKPGKIKYFGSASSEYLMQYQNFDYGD